MNVNEEQHGPSFKIRTPHRNRACILSACAIVLSGAVGLQEANGQCMYEVIAEMKNPTCDEGSGNATITAISDTGIVVGNFSINCGFDVQPFIWTVEGGFVALPLPPGVSEAFAHDVNNDGEIVGSLFRDDVGTRAFRYKDGVWTELPPTGSGTGARANAVSDNGWAVGHRDTGRGSVAIRWRDDVVEVYQPRSGDSAHANDVNESVSAVGQTVGHLQGSQRAFWWFGHTVIQIPPLPGGDTSDAVAINDLSTIVGTSAIPVEGGAGERRSWFFEDGVQIDLGTLPDASRVSAEDINDARQIVGRASGVENNTSTPFLWQHGQMFDLESLIVKPPSGKNLSTARAINNNGWIAIDGIVLAPVGRTLGDVNIDCIVDERDLIAVLEDWGHDKLNHPTDQVTSATFQPPADGIVDAADLAVVLGNWSVSSSQSSTERSR